MDIISDIRGDVKILANNFIKRLTSVREAYVFVDVDSDRQTAKSMKPLLGHLAQGGSLITFPAGQVSRLRWNGIQDSDWNSALFALAAKKGIPVVPIHIRSRASWVFYLTSILVPPLAPLAAISDVARLAGSKAVIEIGHPIRPRRDVDPVAFAAEVR